MGANDVRMKCSSSDDPNLLGRDPPRWKAGDVFNEANNFPEKKHIEKASKMVMFIIVQQEVLKFLVVLECIDVLYRFHKFHPQKW